VHLALPDKGSIICCIDLEIALAWNFFGVNETHVDEVLLESWGCDSYDLLCLLIFFFCPPLPFLPE